MLSKRAKGQDDVEFKALFDGTICDIEAMKAAGYTSILHVAAAPLEILVDTEKLKRQDAHIIKQRAEAWQREKERQATSAGTEKHDPAATPSGSPARSQTRYEVTIVGPPNKKHVWMVHRRPTLAEMERELAINYQDTIAADYTLTWKISNDVLEENFEDIVSQWGGAGLNKVRLELKLSWKRFSGFSLIDGLDYLGFPLSYSIDVDEGEFNIMQVAENTIVDGRCKFGELLDHFAEDLCLRRSALGCPEVRTSEQSRRELISPALVLAVLILGGMQVVADKRVLGSIGNGPLDYAVIWNNFKVLITECKKEQLSTAEGQALAQTAAAREEYVRENVTGVKRRRSDIDDVLPVPSTTIISSGTSYIFYRYFPKRDGEERRLVKSKVFNMDLLDKATPEAIKPQLKRLVGALAGALEFQKDQLEGAVQSQKLKLLHGKKLCC